MAAHYVKASNTPRRAEQQKRGGSANSILLSIPYWKNPRFSTGCSNGKTSHHEAESRISDQPDLHPEHCPQHSSRHLARVSISIQRTTPAGPLRRHPAHPHRPDCLSPHPLQKQAKRRPIMSPSGRRWQFFTPNQKSPEKPGLFRVFVISRSSVRVRLPAP